MSPRRRHPHSDDVRAHLLRAALRAFARQGYDGASIRDIAAEAGLTSGLLYHYFPSKQALLLALFEQSGAMVMAAFAEAAQLGDPAARLAALLRVSARIVVENQDFWILSYGLRFQRSVLEGLAEGIAASNAVYLQLFSQLFAELGRPEPEIEARLLFATLDGLFQHFVLDPQGYPLSEVIEALVHRHAGPAGPESP